MSIEAGTRITSNVVLSRPLGEGGMGSVWVARHEGLDADVAVKFVSSALAEGDAALSSRFRREAALSAKIKSPHVVKTFDYGVTEDGVAYIVMELLEGETLGDRLARESRLVPRDVATVVSQIAQVLEEAHELGVVHRDIKPDNIFLIDAGYDLFCKVLDFGIAKQTTKIGVASVTDTGAIVGTPEYMSPEQLLSPKSADWRVDMWALVVLAYRALTGSVPFTGETLPSLSMAICNARFQPPSQVVDGLPAGVDAWFARGLQPKPDDRFGSVSNMAQLLTELLQSFSEPTVSLEAADTHRQPGQGTLASALSEAVPRLPRPEIGVEVAADDPNAAARLDADTGAFPDHAPSHSGRHRGPVVIEIDRPRSTRGLGAMEREVPSTMRFDGNEERRYSRLRIAGLALLSGLCVAAASLLLRGPGEVLKPELPSSPAPAEPDPLWTNNTAIVPPPRVVEPPTPSPAPPVPSERSAEAPPRPPPILPRPIPSAKSSATAVVSCASPYIVQEDGSLKVKPECVNR